MPLGNLGEGVWNMKTEHERNLLRLRPDERVSGAFTLGAVAILALGLLMMALEQWATK